MNWSDERKEQVKTLWADGLSASQIATKVGGVTRNAVIGVLHRMGLTSANRIKTKQPTPPHVAPKPRLRKVPSPHGNAQPRRYVKPMFAGKGTVQMLETVDAPFVPRQADVTPKNIGLLELNEETCRFPYGDEAPYQFCGHAPAPGSPYCPEHHAICCTEPPRPVSAQESARRSASQKRAAARRRGDAVAA